MQNQDLALLESLEARDAALRRRAAWSAWGFVLLAAVVLLGLIALSYRQVETAQRQVKTAQREVSALKSQVQDENARLERLRTEKARLTAEIADLKPLAERYQRIAVQEIAAARPPEQLSPRVATRQPRAYLQIVQEVDRDSASKIAQKLEEAGFVVPGIENVPRAAGLKNTEVRYYKKAEREGAERLVEALRAAGVESPGLLYLGLENNTKVRPNHYEVWFAAGIP